MDGPSQQLLPFAPFRNVGLFSSHWLDHRLRMEPEWLELAPHAAEVLDCLGDLWKVQRHRVERYGDEQGLEEGFVQPVLRELGWKLKYQPFLQGRKPDYALFLSDAALVAALNEGRYSAAFWDTATVIADAKAWHVSLDRPVKVQNKQEYPPQQIEWYLDRSRLDWGVLTNGRSWRLTPRQLSPQQRRFQTYLECDLAVVLDGWLAHADDLAERGALIEDFRRFYLFFSPDGFAERLGRKPLVRRALEGSSEYRVGVSEGLKGQTFEALRICIEGFIARDANDLSAARDLSRCREQSFTLLGRLLFIMFAEDRRLLPYKVNRLYTDNRALGRLRDDVATQLDRARRDAEHDFSRDSTALWDDLAGLFDLIDKGNGRYGVPAYNGGLFDAGAHPFLVDYKLSDWHLARVIDHLGRAADPDNAVAGLFRVDYRDLAIQHLGGIYEGLLELHPRLAAERMVVYARRFKGVREEVVRPASEPIPKGFEPTEVSYAPGSVYLVTDKGERRAFGSYYTPDPIVDVIVRETLGPLCAALADALAGDEDSDFAGRVLRLRVLDPAMGSGHFLLRACQYLAEEIATNPDTAAPPLAGNESALAYWKRQVVERCLYGVDVNRTAVELAKLALWLETVAADRPLTFLDHHLRHGNSLIGAKVEALAALPGGQGMFREGFAAALAGKLPALLKPLAAIRGLPSESAKQVKDKEARFAEYGRAVEPFRQVADLWCAAAAGTDLTAEQYHAALDVVDKPGRFRKLRSEGWFLSAAAAAAALDPFHWELAFPEVFFDGSGRRERAGFDAVIGNPPYKVLTKNETSRKSKLGAFIRAEPTYDPSRHMKNNLYKLFVCRALDLLADAGRLGFITPMAILGDAQAAKLRRALVAAGGFTAIEAFPEKDDPDNRVFPEAKLATAVICFEKGRAAADRPFRARQHPGKVIEEDTPGVTLITGAIPLRDPTNFTIASRPQADWDLATRIIQSGRMGRLGEFCTSFQGEVNETNEKHKCLSKHPTDGPLILRGANVCLYAVRKASQGEDYYIDEEKFFQGKKPDAKAFHSKEERAGFQRSSPQNNFRRIVAAIIAPKNYCFDTISYVPASQSKLPLK
jgi:type I restriction-modification system DNA methylase subunit